MRCPTWDYPPAEKRAHCRRDDAHAALERAVRLGTFSLEVRRILVACALGFRVRYLTSGALLKDLNAALADPTTHDRVRVHASPDLLIIAAFGFDRIERTACPQAANLWYKIIDARSQRVSTALVTNIDVEAWADNVDERSRPHLPNPWIDDRGPQYRDESAGRTTHPKPSLEILDASRSIKP